MNNNLISKINDIFTPKARLGIMTLLASNDNLDFKFLKSRLELTDGNLGAHMKKLELNGYISIEKVFVDKKPKTIYTITNYGRKLLVEHINQLELLIKMIKD